MGNLCSASHENEVIKNVIENRRRKSVSSIEDLQFSPGSFIQENQKKFHSVYNLKYNPIGCGISGQVHLATHLLTNKTRAIKIIHKEELPAHVISNRSVLKEVEILKTVDHPNVVKIFEYFEDRNDYYIVMEYCKGGDLFTKIEELKRFTEKQAAQVLEQIISAIIYLHSKNIIHRDLKPENIIIENSEEEFLRVKVIDFDTATFYNINERLRGLCGTIYYMAPEVVYGEYDEKCDVWSLGVIMYMLLSGNAPFSGPDEDSILKSISRAHLPMDNPVWSFVSDEAKDLLSLLLVKDPKRRISLKNAYQHPWFQKYRLIQSNNICNILQRIMCFHSTTKLREALHTFIISQVIQSSDLDDLMTVFRAMDTNGDGVISKEELEDSLRNSMDEDEACLEAERIMSQVDSDSNGVIDYTEFLRASMERQMLLSGNNLKHTFELFDKDGNGRISSDELREWLFDGMSIDEELMEKLMQEIDQNGDGEVDLMEFEDLLFESLNPVN